MPTPMYSASGVTSPPQLDPQALQSTPVSFARQLAPPGAPRLPRSDDDPPLLLDEDPPMQAHTSPSVLAFLSHRNLCTAPGRSSPIHNHRTLSQTLFIRFHHSFLASHISKYYIITPLRRSFPSLSTLNHSISSHPSLARISTNLLITRFILITSAIATLAICR